MARVHRYRKVGVAVQGGNDPGRSSNLHMDTPSDSHTPPRPNTDDLNKVIQRLRLSSFIAYALGYTFEALGEEYSSHLAGFSEACDYIGDLMLTSAQILEQ